MHDFEAETPVARKRRARRINRELGKTYPEARTELVFSTPLELAVATILSAQSTDKKINEVTPALFARYPDAAGYAHADRAELEALIHSTGFFRSKAKSLIELGRAVVEHHDGRLPARMDELVALPGFGRKTASVVLGNAFGVAAIAVDTHVLRLANRMGLSQATDAVKVEADLAALIEKPRWTDFSSRMTWHGRRMCHAKTPACGVCPVATMCPSAGIGEQNPERAARLVRGPA